MKEKSSYNYEFVDNPEEEIYNHKLNIIKFSKKIRRVPTNYTPLKKKRKKH